MADFLSYVRNIRNCAVDPFCDLSSSAEAEDEKVIEMEVGSARKPRKPDGKKPRRAIFSIESPFQLLSSIAIIKDEERCIDYSTLVVSNRFKCAEDYVDRLREAGIFDQVILSEYSYRDPKKAPLKEALRGAIYDSRFVE